MVCQLELGFMSVLNAKEGWAFVGCQVELGFCEEAKFMFWEYAR